MPEATLNQAGPRKSPANAPAKAESSAAPTGPAAPAAGLPLFLQSTGFNNPTTPSVQRTNLPAPAPLSRLGVQTKLTVNTPGDSFEQEADEVARRAARPDPEQIQPRTPHPASGPEAIQRKCSACSSDHPCPECAEKRKEEPKVQRLPNTPSSSATPSVSSDTLRPPDGGSPLSTTVRSRIEPVLGADLGAVRVHDSPAAQQTAAKLNAKAFTHQNDIWLGPGQKADNLELMAHEATHVVQQGAGRAPDRVQRLETTTDGEAPRARLFGRIESETGTKITPAKGINSPATPTTSAAPGGSSSNTPTTSAPPAGAAAPAPPRPSRPAKPALTKEQREARSKIDPGEKSAKRGEAEGDSHPDIDRPAQAQPKAAAAARETKQRVDEPPKPVALDTPAAPQGKDKKGKGDEKKGAAPAAPGLGSFAVADSVPQPDTPPPVVFPPPVMPVDAGGKALPPNPNSDAMVTSLATEAQVLREEGLRLRRAAAEMRGNAHALRGNIEIVGSGVGNSEAITTAFHKHAESRHAAADQADAGLAISDQKAATVAEQAPGGVEKANEQKEKSGEVSGEASSLAGESAGQTGDDDDAAAKAEENSGKMNKVSGDIGTIDNAVGQAQSAATTLVQDAAHAKTTNTATRTRLSEVDATLAQTDTKLQSMDAQNTAARGEMAALASGPDDLLAQAQALDEQGIALIETSRQIEARLAASQTNFEQGMKSVPQEEEPKEGDTTVQREPESGPDEVPANDENASAPAPGAASKEIDLTESLPEWLTGEKRPSDEERERLYQENEARRQAEIQEIENSKEGGFESLSQGDKALLALKLTGRNLFGGISKISWPGWGKVGAGAASLVIGLFDPRSALTGALSGVNMIINGSVQFFKQPSWGGLLKLAADIATGITIILGSIVALAGTIAAIMTAISILSFGTLAPICGPVIAFCATVMSTVGGWTFWAGMVALGLQALVFLKDLYAASTAKTAEELQRSSDAMSADAKNAGNAALQAGMGKLAQFGGRAMQAEISAAGGGVNFARNVASKSLLGEAGSGFKSGGLKGFGSAMGKGITRRATSIGKGVKQAVTSPIKTIKDIRAALKSAPKEEPMSLKEGLSKDFLVGPSKEAQVAAGEAKAGGTLKTTAADDVHAPPKTDTAAATQEARLKATAGKEGADLSAAELAHEKAVADGLPKTKISEGDFTSKAELPNGHEIKYTPEGGFCRFSARPRCGGFFGKNATKAQVEHATTEIAAAAKLGTTAEEVSQGAADVRAFFSKAGKSKETEELASRITAEIKQTGKLSDETAAELRAQLTPTTTEGKLTRFDATNQAQVDRLRRQGPVKPADLSGDAADLWPKYEAYYNKRLDDIEAKLASKTPVKDLPEGPRDFGSYSSDPRVRGDLQRGSAFNKSTQADLNDLTKARDASGQPIIKAAEPEVAFKTSKGESTRADHLISYEDAKTGQTKYASVSNKSRTFSDIVEVEGGVARLNEGRLRAQVEADVDELINKYSGRLESRSLQPGFEDLHGSKITVGEVFMHYHVEPIVAVEGYTTREIQGMIKSIAERRAFVRRKNLNFHLIFETQ